MVVRKGSLAVALTLTGVLALGTSEAQTPTQRTTFERRSVGKAFPNNARGRRIALGDVDRDGDPDLLLSGRLLINDGNGRFRWAQGSGLPERGRASMFLDYDHDGDLDVFTTANANDRRDRLYRNDTPRGGKLRFKNVTREVGIGLLDRNPGEGVGAGDVNGDGRPDIYVANYEKPGHAGTQDRLYVSVGKRRYQNATNLVEGREPGRGVSMADFDRDGDMDIFVSNYRLERNFLWVNGLAQTGALSLQNRASSHRVEGTRRNGRYGHTIGSAWGDLDNDNDLDLISANLAHPGWQHFSNMTQVMLNNGNGTFTVHESNRNGLGIKYEESHSNPTVFDADNDGDLDVHITSVYDDAFLYRNLLAESGRLEFRDITEKARCRTFVSWGAAAADVDMDGDLDLVVSAANAKPVLFINSLPRRFKSVKVRLVGTRSDTWGVGATAILSAKGGASRQMRQVTIGHGTSSQSEPVLHFGVGRAPGPFKFHVHWPSGVITRSKLEAHVRGDAPVEIVEPSSGTGLVVRVRPRPAS